MNDEPGIPAPTPEAASARPASWHELLREALLTPGLVHTAYQRFHAYSVRNQLLALWQCAARGIAPGPLGTFKHWQSLGRHVRRGEKALTLCMPVTLPATCERAVTEADDADTEESALPRDAAPRTVFLYRSRWFVLSQTDGKPYEPLAVPSWREETALAALGIARVPFVHADGNVQGYSVGRSIAINPVAALPHKTVFHELGHVLLGHTDEECIVSRSVRELEAECVALLCIESLGLSGAEYARGYVQAWAVSDDLTDAVASRIMTAADRLLRAGRAPVSGASPSVAHPTAA